MIKDRAQKASALKFCISKKWLPQLEVDITAGIKVEKSKYLLTDLDVLAITKSPVGEEVKFIFDCKTSGKESAISRAFWLSGVMSKVNANHGFVILNSKVSLTKDHRLSAADINVSLLHDTELDNLALGLGGKVNLPANYSEASEIEAWEELFAIDARYPALAEYISFSSSAFWVIKDPGEQCRKVVAKLRLIRTELDPSKPEHLAIFGDALCLFLVAISNIANRLFLVLMQPHKKEEFQSLLLAYLYGGYENLQAALKIRKITTGVGSEDAVSIFPETERFEQFVREVMQSPQQALPAALLSRELSLCHLRGRSVTGLQSDIASECLYAPKFVLLAAEYLQKAIKLPPEFSTKFSESVFKLMK